MDKIFKEVISLFEDEVKEINFDKYYTLEDPSNDALVKGFSKDYVTRLEVALKKGSLTLFLTDGFYGSDKKRKFIVGSACFDKYDKHYGTQLILLLEEIIKKYNLAKEIALCDTSDVFVRDGKRETAWTLISKKTKYATLGIY